MDEAVSNDGYDISGIRRDAFLVWATIVQEYSSADLTMERDKLVAISALAKEMQSLMNCRYLAGHWDTHLIRQLGWPGYDIKRRSRVYRAPSWSWASVDGRNQFFFNLVINPSGVRELAEIIDAQVQLLGDDDTGQVTGGHIDVSGKLLTVEFKLPDLDEDGHPSRQLGKRITIESCDTSIRLSQDVRDEDLCGQIFCMPLSLGMDEDNDLEFHRLALQQTNESGVYVRVGSFEIGIGEILGKDDRLLPLLGMISWTNGEMSFSPNVSRTEKFRII